MISHLYGVDIERPVEKWKNIAWDNISERGYQDRRQLLCAMIEELGELSQAVLEHECEDGEEERIQEELDDLSALMIQFQIFIKKEQEV